MEIRELSVPDAFEIVPRQHGDDRGLFLEWYRFEALTEAVGHPLDLRQANLSVSARGTVRGIHFADVPPGQAKYVTCVRGAVMDVVVDIRVGSPAFGRWDAVRLDDRGRSAVYLAEGLGHAFLALSDDATVAYLCSSVYTPAAEHGVHPLDPEVGIDYATLLDGAAPRLSPRDEQAPTLAQAQDAGLLPDYELCRQYYEALRTEPAPSPA